MRVLPRETAPYDEMKTGRLQAVAWRCKAAEPPSQVNPSEKLRHEIADARENCGDTGGAGIGGVAGN
jgi:hypothetical protein